jgi:hypothetical protein
VTSRAARHRRWLRTPLLLAGALVVLGNDGLRLDTLLRDFDIVAFGAEFDQQTDGRLHKWTGPIRYYLDIRAGQAELYRRLTIEHLALLEELTRLDIIEVGDPRQANVVIAFDRDADLHETAAHYAPGLDRAMLHGSLCFGMYAMSASGEIVRGVIGIPSDRAASDGKLPHCIVEETTQVLGLPNDSDEVAPSIFDDRSVLDALSEHDRVLVRLLYDRRLTAGMPRAEALAVARTVLREKGF